MQPASAQKVQFLPWHLNRLVRNAEVRPNWLDDGDRFWYERQTREGTEAVLVDPSTGECGPLPEGSDREALEKDGQAGPEGDRLAATLTHGAVFHWIYVVTVVYGHAPSAVGVLAPLALLTIGMLVGVPVTVVWTTIEKKLQKL